MTIFIIMAQPATARLQSKRLKSLLKIIATLARLKELEITFLRTLELTNMPSKMRRKPTRRKSSTFSMRKIVTITTIPQKLEGTIVLIPDLAIIAFTIPTYTGTLTTLSTADIAVATGIVHGTTILHTVHTEAVIQADGTETLIMDPITGTVILQVITTRLTDLIVPITIDHTDILDTTIMVTTMETVMLPIMEPDTVIEEVGEETLVTMLETEPITVMQMAIQVKELILPLLQPVR